MEWLSVTEAARAVPGRPSTRTLWRWINRGVRGVKLDSCTVGGKRLISTLQLQTFLEQTSGQKLMPFVLADEDSGSEG